MAQAIKSLYGPDIQMAIGPDIQNGFYYDFDFQDKPIKEEQLKEIEKKMKNIIKQNQKFIASTLPIAQAKEYLQSV
jgi:threonyl-tRNA synthetase